MSPNQSRWLDRDWLLVALVAGVAGATLSLLARRYETFPFDRAAEGALTRLGPWFTPIGTFFNERASLALVAVWVFAVVWSLKARHAEIAASFVVAAIVREALTLLKALSDRPRPIGDFLIRDPSTSGSFPSGHVLTVAVPALLWFAVAPELLPRRFVMPLRAVVVLAVALTGISRMWGGAHWLSDVYGALVWSLFAVAAVLAARPAIRRALSSAGTRPG